MTGRALRKRSLGMAVVFLQHVTSIAYFFRETLWWMLVKPLQGKPLRLKAAIVQMDEVGVKSIPIVVLVALVNGIVLVFRTACELQKFGVVDNVPGLATVTLVREMAPFMTAIVLAGRVSAAYTAELGTMMVTEEITALEVMAISPIGFLVVPRFIAMLLMLPCLTILADVVGMAGGYVAGTTVVGIRSSLYIQKSIEGLMVKDLITGLTMSFVFAGIIAMVGCYMAFMVRGGAEGVGRAAMISVVTSLIGIIIADGFFTAIFYLFL